MLKLLPFALAMGLAAPAFATTMEADFTGTILSGFDLRGNYPTGNSNLAGQAYTAKFIFETTGANHTSNANLDSISSGSSVGTPPNIHSAELAIAGQSIVFHPNVSSQSVVSSDLSTSTEYSQSASEILDIGGDHQISFMSDSLLTGSLNPVDLWAQVYATAATLGQSSGSFSLFGYDAVQNLVYRTVYGTLSASSVRVFALAAVPLPAGAWMLIVGLAALAGLKRRKTTRLS